VVEQAAARRVLLPAVALAAVHLEPPRVPALRI
jgi:hypothetical protein